MAFTLAQLAAAETAYSEIMLGVKEGEVSFNGKSIKYVQINPADLLNYITTMKRSLGLLPPRAYARNKKRATL